MKLPFLPPPRYPSVRALVRALQSIGKSAGSRRAAAQHDLLSMIQRYVASGQFDPSVSRALTEGATYAASGAGLGAVAGPYGALAGAAVGLTAGISDGIFGTSRASAADTFGQLVGQLLPIERYLLWPAMRALANYIRRSEGSEPLGPWQLIDNRNVNVAGSRQIVVSWCVQHLWHWDSGFAIDGAKEPNASDGAGQIKGYGPGTGWSDLQVYALACGASIQLLPDLPDVDVKSTPASLLVKTGTEHHSNPQSQYEQSPILGNWADDYQPGSFSFGGVLRSNHPLPAREPGAIAQSRGMADITDQPWGPAQDAAWSAALAHRGISP